LLDNNLMSQKSTCHWNYWREACSKLGSVNKSYDDPKDFVHVYSN